jgi:hypothetical protein
MTKHKQSYTDKANPGYKLGKVSILAVDVAPFPIDWHDLKRFYHFTGYVVLPSTIYL